MNKPGRNDPCHCGSGKKYKHCCLAKDQQASAANSLLILPSSASSAAPYDRALDDPYWEEDDEDEASPLTEAWMVIDEITDEDDAKQQNRLAKKALKLSRDCVGAYYYLGANESDPTKALIYLDQGLAAADRVLAPESLDSLAEGEWIDEEVDWGMSILRTKADLQLMNGQIDDGEATLQRLRRIDPLDRMGAGGWLMMLYLSHDRIDEAKAVEDTIHSVLYPTHEYGAALLKFILQGNSLFARRRLARAFLLDPKVAYAMDPTITLPEDMTDDDLQELFTDEFADPRNALPLLGVARMWKDREGALAWLHEVWELGPMCRFGIETDPEGELLAVTPYESWDFRNCPVCHRPTKPASRTLVTLVEPEGYVVHRVKGRFCPKDRVVIITNEELVETLEAEMPNSDERSDYMPVGTIEPEVLENHPLGVSRETWAFDHRTKLRGIDSYLERETSWFEQMDEEEIDHILEGMGLPPIPNDLLKGIVG